MLIESQHKKISLSRQCALIGLARSSLYYESRADRTHDEVLMRRIDEIYTQAPFYGIRRIKAQLVTQGYEVNVKRIRRLMRQMGLEAIYPKRRKILSGSGSRRFPYLLRDVEIALPNQVWGADITYIRMRTGFLYLMAIMDWFSRYVLSWEISSTLDHCFCVEALERALRINRPQIFNTDQGVQFTSEAFIEKLQEHDIAISMDGQGRVFDNIFVERLWRSVKYEEVYLNEYGNRSDAVTGLGRYFEFYNQRRLHQALNYLTPASIYGESKKRLDIRFR